MLYRNYMISGLSLLSILGMLVLPANSARYEQSVSLQGSTKKTDNISGFAGEKFVVGVPNSQKDDFAIYGITSEERRDNPCYVTILTENINDSGKKLDTKKNLCGGKEKSKEIKAIYSDSGFGKRVFVTGVRVCMNNKDTRVKGIRIRGKAMTEDGNLVALNASTSGVSTGGIQKIVTTEPSDHRANCNKNWKKWAQCNDGYIATAAVLHFDAGKTPRSLTGMELKCRRVAQAR
ncbi:hypothetical protein [Nitrospira sp. M1]